VSQQINLFNPIFLKQKKYFSAVTMAQALGLILLGCALLTGYMVYQATKLKNEAAAAQARLAATQAQLAQITAAGQMRQKDKALEEQVRKAEAEIKSMQDVFVTLRQGDLGNTAGYSEYFRAFSRQIVPGLWLTGLTIQGAGNGIEINGRATRPELVPEYLSRLKRERALQGKSFASLEIQLPKTEQAPVAQGEAKAVAPVNYIEFSLRSPDAAKEKAGGASK
jgi:Tfp pilus assembly protein PilN